MNTKNTLLLFLGIFLASIKSIWIIGIAIILGVAFNIWRENNHA